MSVPDTVADPEAWKPELANAFEVLLGRPLAEFSTETEYAFYYWDEEMSSMMFGELVSGELDLSAIARGELIDGARYHEDDIPFGLNQWALDLGQSTWLFEGRAFEADGGFGESIGAALKAISAATDDGRRAVSGADLARVLAAHGNQLNEVDSNRVMVTLILRIDTDGTLFEAMRAATWTSGGPDSLVELEEGAEVEPEWDKGLQRIPNPRLRDHLRMLTLTAHSARGYGAYFLGPGLGACPRDLDWIRRRPDRETIAGWEFGEGQASSAVFRVK